MNGMFKLGGFVEQIKMRLFNYMLEKNKPEDVPTSGVGYLNYCIALTMGRETDNKDLCVLMAGEVKIINRLTGNPVLDLGRQTYVAYPPESYNFKNEGALENYSVGFIKMQTYPLMVRLQKTGDLELNISEVVVTLKHTELMTIHQYRTDLNDLNNVTKEGKAA